MESFWPNILTFEAREEVLKFWMLLQLQSSYLDISVSSFTKLIDKFHIFLARQSFGPVMKVLVSESPWVAMIQIKFEVRRWLKKHLQVQLASVIRSMPRFINMLK